MALFRIHTARKVFDTDSYAQYRACYESGAIASNGRYLPVKYIEIEQTNGTYRKELPKF